MQPLYILLKTRARRGERERGDARKKSERERERQEIGVSRIDSHVFPISDFVDSFGRERCANTEMFTLICRLSNSPTTGQIG